LNRNQGPIAEATAKRTEAAARFDAMQAKALADIDLASAGFRGAQTNLAILEALLAQQQRQRAAIEAQFKSGAADQLELLNAEAELATAELLRTDAETKVAVASGHLEDAIQRPFDALSFVEENPRMLTDANQQQNVEHKNR
jgi:outer membrane protein, heavy metal efflux system